MDDSNSKDGISNSFIDRVDIELKRAQRYQIFISLLVYDISFIKELDHEKCEKLQSEILSAVSDKIRAIDDVSVLESCKIAFLLPETNRQGAEVASRRISSVLKESLEGFNEKEIIQSIAPEMASYPDAAGARSIKDFLTDYSKKNMN